MSWHITPTSTLHCDINLSQNALLKLLYDTDDPIPDFETILDDIDMISSLQPFDIHKDRNIDFDIPVDILDKLCEHKRLTNILTSTSVPAHQYLIINHNLQYKEIVDAYAYGYKLVHNNDAIIPLNNLVTAMKNGYCAKKIIIPKNISISDQHIAKYVSHNFVKEISIAYKNLKKCGQFTLSLHTLSLHDCEIDDNTLAKCTSLTSLDLSSLCEITTCAPFAKSLRRLRIIEIVHFNYDSIMRCMAIGELHASENRFIKTCQPFARSLRILFANDDCGIGDRGLESCTLIEILSADDNLKITSCDPFAKTLRILSACKPNLYSLPPSNGISDKGLTLCANLQALYAINNRGITTCAPFAKSIIAVSVAGYSGITSDELRRCTSLRHVYAANNKKIPEATIQLIFANDKKHREIHMHNDSYVFISQAFPYKNHDKMSALR